MSPETDESRQTNASRGMNGVRQLTLSQTRGNPNEDRVLMRWNGSALGSISVRTKGEGSLNTSYVDARIVTRSDISINDRAYLSPVQMRADSTGQDVRCVLFLARVIGDSSTNQDSNRPPHTRPSRQLFPDRSRRVRLHARSWRDLQFLNQHEETKRGVEEERNRESEREQDSEQVRG